MDKRKELIKSEQEDFMSDKWAEIPIFATSLAPLLTSFLSLFSNIIVLSISISVGTHKRPFGKMFTWVLISDVIFFLPKVLSGFKYPKSNFFCSVMGGLTEFGGDASFFWATAFAHALYFVTSQQSIESLQGMYKWYFGFSIGTSAIFTFFGIYLEAVECSEDSLACIHKAEIGKTDWTYIIINDIPFMGSLLLSVMWFFLAAKKINAILRGLPKRETFSLLLYPMVMLICWLPISIASLLLSYHINVGDTALHGLEALANSQGFWDAVVYGGWGQIFQSFRTKCCVQRNRESTAISHECENRLTWEAEAEDSNQSQVVLTGSMGASLITNSQM